MFTFIGGYTMNVRQQKYKKNVISGMSKYNAAIAAGYSEGTAKTHTKDLDERVAMADVMERQGLTDKFLAIKLYELLVANKVIGFLHQYKKGEEGSIERIQPEETVSNDFVEVPDWSARAKGLEIAGKLNGRLLQKADQNIASYTQMTVIQLNGKPLELDIGEVPESLKKRMGE